MNGGVDGVVKRWRSAVLTVGGIVLLGCLSAKDLAHERKLQALVQRGATRAEVAQELGPGYTMYERGTPSWDALQRFLRREPANTMRPLRENVRKYPKVMYYTTEWRMTWIFLDEKDVISSYYLTSQ